MSGWFNVGRKNNTYRAPEQPRTKVIRPAEMPPQQMPGYPQYDQNVPPLVARPAPGPGGPAGGGQLAAPAVPKDPLVEYEKKADAAVKKIKKQQLKASIKDMRWRAQAKDLLARNRTEEAESLIRALADSKLRQKTMDKMAINIQTIARAACANHIATESMADLNNIMHALDGTTQKVDAQEVVMDFSERTAENDEALNDLDTAMRMLSDPDGSKSNQLRESTYNEIVAELRKEMTGTMPQASVTPLVQPQAQQPQAINQALLQQLN